MQAPQELKHALFKALESGKFFVTVSYKEGEPPNDLQHFWITRNYPTNDLESTLNHLKDDVVNKEIRKKNKADTINDKKEEIEWL